MVTRYQECIKLQLVGDVNNILASESLPGGKQKISPRTDAQMEENCLGIFSYTF